jgi:hypothetical protein
MNRAWRELARLVSFQCAAGLVGAVIAGFWHGVWVGGAFFYGAALLASANLLSARFGLRKVSSPVASLGAVLGGIAWKWLWLVAGVYLAFSRWHLAELAVVLGLITAQLAAIVAGASVKQQK